MGALRDQQARCIVLAPITPNYPAGATLGIALVSSDQPDPGIVLLVLPICCRGLTAVAARADENELMCDRHTIKGLETLHRICREDQAARSSVVGRARKPLTDLLVGVHLKPTSKGQGCSTWSSRYDCSVCRETEQLAWAQVYGASLRCGIGFTTSLFIGLLAISSELQNATKIGIVSGSVLSAVVGTLVLAFAPCEPPQSAVVQKK